MENSNLNNDQVSYEIVNDDSDNDNNIIILMDTERGNEKVDKKVDMDSPNRRSKINKKISSPKKGHRQESKIIPKISLSNEEEKLHKKEEIISPRKRDPANRKYYRKNAKKNIAQKKRRGGEEIKVVGKVSAKLSSLIARLQQNTISSQNKVNTQFEGDKVIMAPRIKAALEKFNKKKQDQTQLIYGQPYKRYYQLKDDKSNKGEREDGSTINYEEEEYEEDEDYEEEDEEEEEEEEEEEKGHQRKHKPSVKKRKKKDISNDGDSNYGTSEKKKKKKKRRKRKDGSYEEEDEDDDESEYEYDENGKRRRKRKKRRRKKNDIIEEESSEYEDSEEEEEEDEDGYTIDKKTGKKVKKNKSNDISDDKSSDKGKIIPTRRKRGISTHKSGKGKVLERSKDKNDTENSNKNNDDNNDDNDNNDNKFPVIRRKKRGVSIHKSGQGKVLERNKDRNDTENSNKSNDDNNDDNDNNDNKFPVIRRKKRGVSIHKSGQGKVLVRNKDKNDSDNANKSNDDNNDDNNNDNNDNNDDNDNKFQVIRRKKRGVSIHKSGQGKVLVRNKDKNDSDNANINNDDKNDNNGDNVNKDDNKDRVPVIRKKKREVSTHKSGHGKVLIRNKDKNDSGNANINNDDKNDNNGDNDNSEDSEDSEDNEDSEDRFPVVRNKKRAVSTHKSGRGKVMLRNKDKDDLDNNNTKDNNNNKDNDNTKDNKENQDNNDDKYFRRSLNKHRSGKGQTIIRNNSKDNGGEIKSSDDEGKNNPKLKLYSDSDDSDSSGSSSSSDDADVNKNSINRKRGISKHKSGRGQTIIKKKEKRSDTPQTNSDQDIGEEIPKEQEEYLIRNFGAIKHGSFLLVRKVPVKAVMFERFAHKQYTITNYKSKVNGQRIMKELKKYMPCKQTDFILYASYDPEYEEFIKSGGRIIKRKAISSTIRKNKLIKKPLNLNKPIGNKNDNKKNMNNSNTINNISKKSTKNSRAKNNQNEEPDIIKSFFNKMSNNNLDNKYIEKKLFDIEKLKNSLKNEMNEQLNKKRRRHQSIILTNYLDIHDFTSKNRNSSKIINDKGNLKSMKNLGNKPNDNNNNKVKTTKMNINDIVKKRGLDVNNKESGKTENLDSDINGNKKVKFDLFKAKKPKLGNKNQGEVEEEEVLINDDGVKYLVFELRNDLKMIYRKTKWKLARSNRISIFLKAVKPNKYKDIPKKKNNKVLFNVDENEKNDEIPIYKRKGDNFKLVKGSLNKKQINKNNYMYPFQNNNRSVSEESEDKNKESRNKKGIDSSNIKLYYDLFKTYDSEKKDNDLFKSMNSNSNSNDERDKYMTHKAKYTVQNDYIDNYLSNYYNRREKKRYTTRIKRMPRNTDYYEFEENSKNINKVKSKKAKIRKFKSHRDNFETEKKEKPIRGFIYDYIHNKRNRLLYIDNTIKRKMKSNAHLNRSENTRERNNNENYFNYDTFNKTNFSDARGSRKHSRALSANRNKNKLKKIKNESESNKKKNNSNNNNNRTINYNNNKYNNNYYNSASTKNEKSKIIKIINNPVSKTIKRRKNIEDNPESKLSMPRLNNSQYRLPRKIGYENYLKKNSNPNMKSEPKNFQTISMPIIPKQNYKKKKVKVSREESGIDAVKSKFKIKLIEINDALLDAIHYYNGPIDISCISSKNYLETVEDLNKKVLKNGFKCIKNETNYFKFSNGLSSFLVEIVKIRNNMLYYLVLKNQ